MDGPTSREPMINGAFPNLIGVAEFAYDTETTGLNPADGSRVFGFSISTHDRDWYWDIREVPGAVGWINETFMHMHGTVICHNLSFDYRSSYVSGIKLPLYQAVDTCVLACLINEHEVSYSLDNLARRYTRSHKSGQELYDKLADLFGGRRTKNVQMPRIQMAPSSVVGPYAMDDTRATFELYQWQKRQIDKQGLHDIVEFERKLTPLLIDSEMRGVRVDINKAEQARDIISKELDTRYAAFVRRVGFEANYQPSKDTVEIFKPKKDRSGRWISSCGTEIPSTDTGAPSFTADVLRSMSHPAAADILELRSLAKTRDTFIEGHILGSQVNGRVYPSINQAKTDHGGTGTGRLSYTSPALQQIPDRNKEVAKTVKEIFLPEEGHQWVDADLASFEVRVFGHLVGSPEIIRAYEDDPETDFHQWVADETGLPRNATYNGEPNAKQLNLSMIFNQGKGTTAEVMGMPWSWDEFVAKDGTLVRYKKPGPEAMEVIERYHRKLPGVRKLIDGCMRKAESRGYIFTRNGRHLRFPGGFKSYKASGILIQATAADENKRNWMRIYDAIGNDGFLLLNTHDSYSMSIGEDIERVARRVKEAVEADRGMRVPLILEVQKPGSNWWESKSNERWM